MAPGKKKKELNPMDPANTVGENSHNERTRYQARDYNCFAYDPVYGVAKIAEGERIKFENPPGWHSFPHGRTNITTKTFPVPPTKGYPTKQFEVKYNPSVMQLNELNVRRRQSADSGGKYNRLAQNAAAILVQSAGKEDDSAGEVPIRAESAPAPTCRHFFKLVKTQADLDAKRAEGTLHVAPVITQDIARDEYLERIVQRSFGEKPKNLRYPHLEEWSRNTFFPHREVRRS
jgi:hypothetical protein